MEYLFMFERKIINNKKIRQKLLVEKSNFVWRKNHFSTNIRAFFRTLTIFEFWVEQSLIFYAAIKNVISITKCRLFKHFGNSKFDIKILNFQNI